MLSTIAVTMGSSYLAMWWNSLSVGWKTFVHIDSMQFGFVPGRGTTDLVFIICKLQ